MNKSGFVNDAMPPELARMIEGMREKFIADICVKLHEIETLQSELTKVAGRGDALRALSFIAHRLSGVAATVGFRDLGDCASAVEAEIMAQDKSPSDLSLLSARIDDLLDHIEDAIIDG
ncbi:Hpt domain-containing protein [Pacificibacter marinus]|nr:Hpt domain-containing protein [Pacificibacter marinus]